jgi:hypothetical protein
LAVHLCSSMLPAAKRQRVDAGFSLLDSYNAVIVMGDGGKGMNGSERAIPKARGGHV